MSRPLDFEALAQLFAATYSETGSIADALRVVIPASRRPHHHTGAAGLNDIIAAAGARHGVRPEAILSARRHRPGTPLAMAREEAWYVARQRGLSPRAIGAAFERDPGLIRRVTVRLAALAEHDAELRARLAWAAADSRQRRTA